MPEKIRQTLQRFALPRPSTPPEPRKDVTGNTDLPGDPNCPYCHGVGYLRRDLPITDPEFGKVIPCDCWKAQREEREQARVAAELAQVDTMSEAEHTIMLADIKADGRAHTKKMLTAARSFVAHPFSFLTVWGGPGNAKTTLLQAVINELVAKKHRAVYITAFDLMGYIRQAFTQEVDRGFRQVKNGSAYERILQLETIEILAIDELDKIKLTDWTREQLTDLVDKRYRAALDEKSGTLIAMNNDPSKLDEHLYSRLRDGRFTIVCNNDPDVRPYMQDDLGNGFSESKL